MPINKPKATCTRRWDGAGASRWSLYKVTEPVMFSESTEVWGYLHVEKKLSTFFIAVRTLWFEHDKRYETQAFPSDNIGEALQYLSLFEELRVFDHDNLMTQHGYEVRNGGI